MFTRIALLLAVVMSASLISAAPAAADTSYPMTCQLGKANHGFIQGNGSWIAIGKSSQPASAGLQPGQCAFEDRGIRPSEPGKICFNATVEVLGFENGQALGFFTNFGGPAASFLPAVVFGGTTQLVNMSVHNDNNGCFFVDKFGV